jgi:hypothetical protein
MTNRQGAVVSFLLLGASVMLALLLGTGGLAGANGSHPDNGEEPGDGATTEPPEACSAEEAIQDDLLERGFEIGEFSIDDTVWAQNPRDNVGGAFHGRVERRAELSRFLRGDAPESRATRQEVLSEIPNGERARALSGNGYTDVQFHVPVNYAGNAMWDGERVITPTGVKHAKSGDVVWVYVTQACDVIWSASVRADCGNVGYHDLVPVRLD